MHSPGSRLALAVLVSAAFALRLTNLTFQPLWFDEGWSVWFATSDLPSMAARTAVDIHPPFYYALLHFWIGAAGSGEFALRLLSVFVGVLTVVALYRFAQTLAGEKVGWLAAGVVALSPLQVYYAQEIRMYGLVTLLGIASSWLFWTALLDERSGNRRRAVWRWAAYVVVTGAALYTQYYAAFIPLFHFFFLLLTVRRRSEYLYPLASFATLFLLFVPWLLYAGPRLADYVGNKIGIEKYDPVPLAEYILRHLSAFSVGHLDPGSEWLAWASWLFAALAFIGLLSLWRLRAPVPAAKHVSSVWHSLSNSSQPTTLDLLPRSAIFLILYLLVPVAAAYLVQLRFPFAPPRMERLLLLASPPFLVIVAAGIGSLGIGRWSLKIGIRSRLANLLSVIAAGAVVITAIASLAYFYVVPRYPEQDYRALAARIEALALPSDVVVCVHPWQVGFLQAYLAVPLSIQLVADPAWGDIDRNMLDAALAGSRRVWLPAYQTLGRILESEMERYLSQHALTVNAQWYQETRLSFYAPSPGEPTIYAPFTPGQSQEPDFTLFDPRLSLGRAADAAESQAGWSTVPLYLRWRLKQPLGQLSYSLRLYDQTGRLWSAQEREPLMGIEPMSGWALNTDYVDRIGFLIPAGVPPGSYSLHFLLYRAGDGQQVGPDATITQLAVVRPQMPARVTALSIQTPLIVDWPGQRLLGYSLGERAWLPGEAMHVDLFWQALDGPRSAGRSFVQVQDVQGKVVALDKSQTFYPPSNWQSGELVREQRDLTLPATLPAGIYVVTVGLLQPDSTTHVRTLQDGDPINLRKIAVISRPHQLTAPTPQNALTARFAESARIVGYDLNLQGNTVTLRLYWQALNEMDTMYKVFVHIVPPGSTVPAAQHDSPPANGSLPTTTWIKAEYITDEHVITMPADLPTGSYLIVAGLYDPQTGARLPAFGSDGHEYANDAANIGPLEWK
jgi:uncharacterized membrane protein